MSLRIATFNLENLFERPAAMNFPDDDEGRIAIEDHARANAIVKKDVYSEDDKAALVAMTMKYGWHKLNAPKKLVLLQKVRGQLFRTPKNGPVTVVANGRADWTGWFELRKQDVKWTATYNTGRVIAEVKPDILVIVEVESRPTFQRFNEQVLQAQLEAGFPHFMVIDGNDDRGIDVGIASRFPIEAVRSHVDDRYAPDPQTPGKTEKLFSRDCPEYDVLLPGGNRLVVLPNHFKSKRNGTDAAATRRRTAQADGANAHANAALVRSPYVIIAGDLNDTPDSSPMAGIGNGGFRDVSMHADYPQDRPGTYGTGLAGNKIDYIIMSPALQAKLKTTGIERRGTYHPGVWQPFDTVKSEVDQASDHQLLWADFDL